MDVTDDAVQNLVTQFSSALDFYRELVQNSIDAGSDAVEVWLEFLPGEEGGTIAIHVDDFGEGMDEDIIDSQLTRLFSSSKENDLTKIGKFGIGFVSVFALGPKAVLIHTGRGGEYWEILFHEDRSFNKSRVDAPVEGTQITLFIEGDRSRYRELVVESRRTLRHWCGHSDVEIRFEDRSSAVTASGSETINRPFAVEGECARAVEAEETQIAVAYSREPIYGFYNKGLALAVIEGANDLVPDRLRHVAFKIKSRYLEHTLSRETVMRDHNFDKAMQLVLRAADEQLFNELVTRTRAHVASTQPWGLGEIERYLELIAYLAAEPFEAVLARAAVPVLRTVDGGTLSLEDVWTAVRADGQVFVSDAATPLTNEIIAQGTPVLLARGLSADGREVQKDGVFRLVRAFLEHKLTEGIFGFFRARFAGAEVRDRADSMIVAPESVMMSVDLEVDAGEAGLGLIDSAAAILERSIVTHRKPVVRPFGQGVVEPGPDVEVGYARLLPCRVTSRTATPPLFVVGRRVGPLMALPPPGTTSTDRASRPEAAVNIGHPQFRGLVELWAEHPRLAAYCLAKDLLLAEDRLLERDLALISAAREGTT